MAIHTGQVLFEFDTTTADWDEITGELVVGSINKMLRESSAGLGMRRNIPGILPTG